MKTPDGRCSKQGVFHDLPGSAQAGAEKRTGQVIMVITGTGGKAPGPEVERVICVNRPLVDIGAESLLSWRHEEALKKRSGPVGMVQIALAQIHTQNQIMALGAPDELTGQAG